MTNEKMAFEEGTELQPITARAVYLRALGEAHDANSSEAQTWITVAQIAQEIVIREEQR